MCLFSYWLPDAQYMIRGFMHKKNSSGLLSATIMNVFKKEYPWTLAKHFLNFQSSAKIKSGIWRKKSWFCQEKAVFTVYYCRNSNKLLCTFFSAKQNDYSTIIFMEDKRTHLAIATVCFCVCIIRHCASLFRNRLFLYYCNTFNKRKHRFCWKVH